MIISVLSFDKPNIPGSAPPMRPTTPDGIGEDLGIGLNVKSSMLYFVGEIAMVSRQSGANLIISIILQRVVFVGPPTLKRN